MRSLSTVCAAAIAAVWAGTACPGESPGADAERLARLVAAEAARTPPSVLLPHYKFMAEHARDESVRREATWHLARVCIALGRRDEAGKLLDELSSRVDDRWGRAGALRLGELYREQKQPERAIEAFERILGKNLIVPEAVRAALGVAEILESRGESAKAIKALEYAKAVAARLYEEDRRELADVIKKVDEALARLVRARKVAERGEAAVLLEEANAALERKDYGTVLAKCSELLARFPAAPEADEAGYKRGLALYLSGDSPGARSAWEEFVKAKPEGPWRGHALVGLADIWLEYEFDAASAGRAIERALEGASRKLANWSAAEGDAWLRKAVVEYVSNRCEECLAALDRALKFRPVPKEIAEHGIPWGPGKLAMKLRSGKELTPAEVRSGGSVRARTAIVLGDLYYEMQEWEKAGRLYAKLNPSVAATDGKELTEETWRERRASSRRRGGKFDPVEWLKELSKRKEGQPEIKEATHAQRAYARLKEARTRQHTFDFEGALTQYGAFLDEFKDTPWRSEGVLRAAIVSNQMPPGGMRLAEELLRFIYTNWPRDKWAPTAAVWWGWLGKYTTGYEEAFRRFAIVEALYPSKEVKDSVRRFRESLERERREEEAQNKQSGNTSKE